MKCRVGAEWTYGDAGNVGMPDFGHELHVGWLEGILGGYLDVDEESASSVRSVWGPMEDALEMGEIIENIGAGRLVEWLEYDAGVGVFLDVLNLLDEASVPVGRHGASEEAMIRVELGRVWDQVVKLCGDGEWPSSCCYAVGGVAVVTE